MDVERLEGDELDAAQAQQADRFLGDLLVVWMWVLGLASPLCSYIDTNGRFSYPAAADPQGGEVGVGTVQVAEEGGGDALARLCICVRGCLCVEMLVWTTGTRGDSRANNKHLPPMPWLWSGTFRRCHFSRPCDSVGMIWPARMTLPCCCSCARFVLGVGRSVRARVVNTKPSHHITRASEQLNPSRRRTRGSSSTARWSIRLRSLLCFLRGCT